MAYQSTERSARTGTDLRRVAEVQVASDIPLWRHPGWAEDFPWMVQGTTASGAGPGVIDLGLFGETPVGCALGVWRRLRESTGFPTAVHSRQVHGARVAQWGGGLPPGLVLTEGQDAHTTATPGVLLTVSVADCVPVFLVSERARTVAVAHAGWRGVAAGVIEAVLVAISPDGDHAGVHVHCGPSICGECYEVGPEVHLALRPDAPPPLRNRPVDLSLAIARRAVAAGVDHERITSSAHCTLCGTGRFFSHRGGSKARQMGVIGIRAEGLADLQS